MRKLAFVLIIALAGCGSQNSSSNNTTDSTINNNRQGVYSALTESAPIIIDTANKMLGSYLLSVNVGGTDTNLRSLIVNADTLRTYLQDTSIRHLKLMFAHTLTYINGRGKDHNCGYNNADLTMIIVGYNSSNNYVYNQQGLVYDNCVPCPTNCPISGTASEDIFPVSESEKSNNNYHSVYSVSAASAPVTIDTANKMLESYLLSINAGSIDTNLQSLIVNADTLRNYLKDTSIRNFKLMFAHTLTYINGKGRGINCRYSNKDLTLIIVGYNSSNNYVYNQQGLVYDNCTPCPTACPTSGTASESTLPEDKSRK